MGRRKTTTQVTSTTPVTTISTFRGVMLDTVNTSLIIADLSGTEVSNFIKFVTQQTITAVYVYGLSGIIGTKSKEDKLAAFILKCRAAGVKIFAAQRASATSHLTSGSNTCHYNDSRGSSLERFDCMGQEQEFWQPLDHLNLVPYATFAADSTTINNAANSRLMTNDCYVARCRDLVTSATANTIAEQIIKTHKRVLLTNYITADKWLLSPGTAFSAWQKFLPQLNIFGQAAKNLLRNIEIVVLINTNTNDVDGSGAYLDTHTPADMWKYMLNAFNADSTVVGKQYINFSGYMLYAYDDVKRLIV